MSRHASAPQRRTQDDPLESGLRSVQSLGSSAGRSLLPGVRGAAGMCGIVAFCSEERRIEPELLASMTDSLSHRGPDDRGTFISRKGRLGLGHRRLSIIDLSGGRLADAKSCCSTSVAESLSTASQVKSAARARRR